MWWKTKHGLLTAALVSFIGVTLVALGEWLMLYSPTGGYGALAGQQNFLHASPERIQLGFFLAVLAAPVYALAYAVIATALQLSTRWRLIMVGLAIFGFSVGNVWLGSNAYIAYIVQAEAAGLPLGELRLAIESLSEPLLQVVRGSMAVLSLITIVAIVRGGTYYPRVAILATPLLLTIAIFALYVWVPTVGNIFLPAALNIAHSVFMLVTVFFIYVKTTAKL